MSTRWHRLFDRAGILVGTLLHALVARLTGRFGRDDALWVFGARGGRAFADNAKYLYLHVVDAHPEVRAVWLSRDAETVRTLQNAGYEAYRVRSPYGAWLAARAGVVVLTHGLRDVPLPWSGGALTVMLWHGVPLKTVSWDAEFPEAPWPLRVAYRYASRQYDLVTVPTPAAVGSTVSGLGVSPDRIRVVGYPRNDALDGSVPGAEVGIPEATAGRLERLAASHRIAVYFPTYREAGANAGERLDVAALEEVLAARDAYLVVKPHPNERLDLPADADRIVPFGPTDDPYPLLGLADVLVTDYSSVMFDFLALDRPIVLFAPDLEEYRSRRGFYWDYERIAPGPIARDADALVRELDRALAGDPSADRRREVREALDFPPAGGSETRHRSTAVYDAIRQRLSALPRET